MITPEQSQGLRKLIGSKHISKISKYFYQVMRFNRDGDPYHHNSISEVFNSRKENPNIEEGIWEFAKYLKKEKEKEDQRKAEILSSVKPAQQ